MNRSDSNIILDHLQLGQRFRLKKQRYQTGADKVYVRILFRRDADGNPLNVIEEDENRRIVLGSETSGWTYKANPMLYMEHDTPVYLAQE